MFRHTLAEGYDRLGYANGRLLCHATFRKSQQAETSTKTAAEKIASLKIVNLTHRLALMSDIEDIKALMSAAIYELQKDFLSEEQLEVAWQFMGVDTSLIEDQTYLLIIHDQNKPSEMMVGCGGWGKRKTLYGGNHSPGRDESFLDPAIDRARIRAMYCHPLWARKGIGRMIINLCEAEARKAGFTKMTLGSTLAGQPLYEACGYKVIEKRMDRSPNGVEVPVIVMNKDFD